MIKFLNSSWLKKKKEGLYCIPGDFFIDPILPVKNAVITHAHTDHARANNTNVLATFDTIEIMKIRYGENFCERYQIINYNEKLYISNVSVKLIPAGHIIGSAQICLEYKGHKVVISGDYKRVFDKTCAEYQIEKCHTFVTEATFGLPVFSHPRDVDEIEKLINSLLQNDKCIHLIGVYALGKCQRVISLLRDIGYNETIYVHTALLKISEYYVNRGIDLGKIKKVSCLEPSNFSNQLVLCPPSALNDRWSRKFKNSIKGIVSGWMNIKQRVKQKNIQLPIVISDHADWDDILLTVKEINPNQVLVTHGREEALIFQLQSMGYKSQALNLLGYEDDYE